MGLFGHSKSEKSLIFYIDSSSVGAAIVELSISGKPTILWSKRSEIAFREELDFANFQSQTIKTLVSIIEDCARNAAIKPHRFIGVLSSPWFVSQTRVSIVKSDKMFLVTEDLIKKISLEEVEKFESERRKTNDIILDDSNSFIELRTMRTELNGYVTNKPYDKKTKDLRVTLFLSMSSNRILDVFRSVISKAFHAKTVEFHTLPFIAYGTLRDIVPGPDQFIFIDINGEITDLSIVNNGIIMETVSFPLGYNFLMRRIANTFKSTPAESLTLLETYNSGQLHGAFTGKLEGDIAYAKSEWMKSFANVLEKSSFDYLLPDNAYIVGHRSTAKYFNSFISDESLKRYTITNKPFTVNVITSDLLKNFCNIAPRTASDVFLFLPAIFQQKIFNL